MPVPIHPDDIEKILAAEKILTRNLHYSIPVGIIAGELGITTKKLASLFKKHFGKTVLQYQIELRIEKSKLLLEKGYQVTEVATRVGYHDIHTFSKTFKKHTGFTPTEYRSRGISDKQ